MIEVVVGFSVSAIIAVGGYLLRRVYMDPLRDYRKLKGQIASSLIYYANLLSNPGCGPKEDLLNASNALRKLASELSSCLQQLPSARVLRTFFRTPSDTDVKEASRELIGLSNGVFEVPDEAMFQLIDVNHERAKNVKKLLLIK